MKPLSKTQKKRRMLVALPMLIVPFATLLFWSLGGGSEQAEAATSAKPFGLNWHLPDAQLSDKSNNKLSLYQQALADSEQLAAERKEDPYGSIDTTGTAPGGAAINEDGAYTQLPQPQAYTGGVYGNTDANEEKVRQKLDQLNRSLQQDNTAPGYETTDPQTGYGKMQQLQQAEQQVQAAGSSGGDPDIDRINSMLQKVLDIEHPQAAAERMRAASEKHRGQVFSVTLPRQQAVSPLMQAGITDTKDSSYQHAASGFYGLGDNTVPTGENNKAIPAVVGESQTLVSGATLKMQLDGDIYIAGTLIPKGTFVYGACQLDGERLKVTLNSIRYGDQLFPVALAVYDMDGMAGIRIPGAITRDEAKQGMNQGIQAMDIMSMDQSLGAQAASAGIEATKSLLGHKVRLIRATIPAGYPVLLRDNNKRDNPQ